MSEVIAIFLMFILGAGVGSFIDVLVAREKVAAGRRSRCQHCRHQLAWADIVPVLSYLLLRGKCRYCGGKISPRHIAVEILVGCLFALSFLTLDLSLLGLAWWLCIISLLIYLFLTDLYYQKMKLSTLLILTTLSLIFTIFTEAITEQKSYSLVLTEHLLALALPGLFAICWAASRGRLIGLGDVWLGVAIAILISWQQAAVVLLAASVLTVIYWLLIRRKARSRRLPFGAFLIVATLAVRMMELLVDFL